MYRQLISLGPSAEQLHWLAKALGASYGAQSSGHGGIRIQAPHERLQLGEFSVHHTLVNGPLALTLSLHGRGHGCHLLVLPFATYHTLPLQPLFHLLHLLDVGGVVLCLVDDTASPDLSLMALAQEELESLCVSFGLQEAQVCYVAGSTPELDALVESLHKQLKLPQVQDIEGPFWLPIEDRIEHRGRSMLTGRVCGGDCKVGDALTLLAEEPISVELAGIEMYRRPLSQAQAGDVVALVLTERGIGERGQLLVGEGHQLQQGTQMRALLHCYEQEERLWYKPISSANPLLLHVHTGHYLATCELVEQEPLSGLWSWEPVPSVAGGHTCLVTLQCEEPLWWQPGQVCPVRVKGSAAGFVVLVESVE